MQLDIRRATTARPDLVQKMGFHDVTTSPPSPGFSRIFRFWAPEAHPRLMAKSRELLGVENSLKRKVVYISRVGGADVHNRERALYNEDEFIHGFETRSFDLKRNRQEAMEMQNVAMLNTTVMKSGFTLVVHRTSSPDLSPVSAMFGDAALIIGAHGGGLYNHWFASKCTRIIEIFPQGKEYPQIWFQAALIGQPYYRMYGTSSTGGGFSVDVNSLNEVVNRILTVPLSQCEMSF